MHSVPPGYPITIVLNEPEDPMHYQHTLERACHVAVDGQIHVVSPTHGPLGSHAEPFRIFSGTGRELARWYIERENDPDGNSAVHMHVGATSDVAELFLGMVKSPDPSEVH